VRARAREQRNVTMNREETTNVCATTTSLGYEIIIHTFLHTSFVT